MEGLILNVKNIIRTKIISSETDLEFIKNIERYEGFCIGIVVITDDEIDIQFRGTISEHSKTIGNYIVNRIRTFKHKLLGNIKFFLSLNDGIDFPSDIKDFINRHILLLLFCDFIDSPLNEILIPDPYMSVESNRKILESVYNLQIPFFDRKPIAKFRGSQTGMPLQYNMDEVKLLRIARLKAVHLSLDFPDLLDVRFINSYDIQNNGGKEYTDYMNLTFGPPSEPESFEKFNNYRYLISFDGNFVAFSRPELIMSSGSVPLIQTRYKKYWSDFLEDGKII